MISTVTRCAHCGALELDGLEVDVQRREVRWHAPRHGWPTDTDRSAVKPGETSDHP